MAIARQPIISYSRLIVTIERKRTFLPMDRRYVDRRADGQTDERMVASLNGTFGGGGGA